MHSRTWEALRSREYDAEEAETALHRFLNDQSHEHAERLIVAVLPLLGKVIGSRFRHLADDTRDDVTSFVAMTLLRFVPAKESKLRATRSVSGYLHRSLKHFVVQFLAEQETRFDPAMATQTEWWTPEPSFAETREEIDVITRRAVAPEYSADAVRVVLLSFAKGAEPPLEMLRNWMGVADPAGLVAHVRQSAAEYLSA